MVICKAKNQIRKRFLACLVLTLRRCCPKTCSRLVFRAGEDLCWWQRAVCVIFTSTQWRLWWADRKLDNKPVKKWHPLLQAVPPVGVAWHSIKTSNDFTFVTPLMEESSRDRLQPRCMHTRRARMPNALPITDLPLKCSHHQSSGFLPMRSAVSCSSTVDCYLQTKPLLWWLDFMSLGYDL